MRRDRTTRSSLGRASSAVLAVLCATGAVAGATASACVPQPLLVTVEPRASGPVGSRVTVRGLGLDPERAEVRWNAVDGELLAAANGPDFSADVTIPDAEPGVYYLVVLARAPGGEIGNTRAVAFQVTPATAAAPSGSSPAPAAAGDGGGEQAGVAAGHPGDATSVSEALLFGGGGGLVALGFLAGWSLARRRRPPVAGGTGPAGDAAPGGD